jgi:hypothetical protein
MEKKKRKLSDAEQKKKANILQYFTETTTENAGTIEERVVYKCLCGTTRSLKPGAGYTNLTSHLISDHPDYDKKKVLLF